MPKKNIAQKTKAKASATNKCAFCGRSIKIQEQGENNALHLCPFCFEKADNLLNTLSACEDMQNELVDLKDLGEELSIYIENGKVSEMVNQIDKEVSKIKKRTEKAIEKVQAKLCSDKKTPSTPVKKTKRLKR